MDPRLVVKNDRGISDKNTKNIGKVQTKQNKNIKSTQKVHIRYSDSSKKSIQIYQCCPIMLNHARRILDNILYLLTRKTHQKLLQSSLLPILKRGSTIDFYIAVIILPYFKIEDYVSLNAVTYNLFAVVHFRITSNMEIYDVVVS
jgi:hypothetical protein